MVKKLKIKKADLKVKKTRKPKLTKEDKLKQKFNDLQNGYGDLMDRYHQHRRTMLEIIKKLRYGLKAQIKRKDRDPIAIGNKVADDIIEMCNVTLNDE